VRPRADARIAGDSAQAHQARSTLIVRGRERRRAETLEHVVEAAGLGELAIEVDYPGLATYERETAAYFADEECMKLIVDGMKDVRPDSAGYNEMWQRAEPVTAGA
jgi:hypothetical protein